MIAEIRRVGALPILAWLFLFPVVITGVAVMDRHAQRSAATRAVGEGASVLWAVTPRSPHGYRYKHRRLVCVIVGADRRLIRVVKVRSGPAGAWGRWTSAGAEPVGVASSAPYMARCQARPA